MLKKMRPDEFSQVFEIMVASFPESERRDYAGEKALLDLDYYHIYVFRDDDKDQVQAFIAIWDLDDFLYVEHFAVSGQYRNLGLGGKILDEFADQADKTIILEVEPPQDEWAKRRIGFYKRHEFHYNDYAYFQPKLSIDHPELPLRLMSYPEAMTEEQFIATRKNLYAKVYDYSLDEE